MIQKSEYSAIVLAGGQSSRMGRPKAELPFGAGTMLDFVVGELANDFAEILVAIAQAGRYTWQTDQCRSIVDLELHRGPVSALEQALRQVDFDRAFVCSCDVPFVNGDFARELCRMLGDDQVLIPRVDGKLQMLHAVYRKECSKALATMRKHGERRLHQIVNFTKARIVAEDEIRALDPELLSFFNVNTPEDYQAALKLLDDRSAR